MDFFGLILPFGYISESAYKHISMRIYKQNAMCDPMTYKNGKITGKSLQNHCRLPLSFRLSLAVCLPAVTRACLPLLATCHTLPPAVSLPLCLPCLPLCLIPCHSFSADNNVSLESRCCWSAVSMQVIWSQTHTQQSSKTTLKQSKKSITHNPMQTANRPLNGLLK